MKRKSDIDKIKELGFTRFGKNIFFCNYRSYGCYISSHRVSIGLKPCIKISIEFGNKKDAELLYLRKKYRAVNIKWYSNALEYYYLYNFFAPRYNEVIKVLDEMIDVLDGNGNGTEGNGTE